MSDGWATIAPPSPASPGIIGYYARWRHLDDAGRPVLPVAGVVASVRHSASRGFMALILIDDGTLEEHATKDLVVTHDRLGHTYIPPVVAGVGFGVACGGDIPPSYVPSQPHPPVAAPAPINLIRARMLELGLIDADADDVAAAQVIGDLRSELLRLSEELAEAVAALAAVPNGKKSRKRGGADGGSAAPGSEGTGP